MSFHLAGLVFTGNLCIFADCWKSRFHAIQPLGKSLNVGAIDWETGNHGEICGFNCMCIRKEANFIQVSGHGWFNLHLLGICTIIERTSVAANLMRRG